MSVLEIEEQLIFNQLWFPLNQEVVSESLGSILLESEATQKLVSFLLHPFVCQSKEERFDKMNGSLDSLSAVFLLQKGVDKGKTLGAGGGAVFMTNQIFISFLQEDNVNISFVVAPLKKHNFKKA